VEIIEGLDEKNLDQLIEYTMTDESVAKFTSDRKRFCSPEGYREWLKKGRTIYCMVDDKGDLTGITWFGFEGDGFTLAIRVYGSARGKGLALGFLKETMERYKKTDEYKGQKNKRFWLEVSKDNVAAMKTYEKLGFEFERDGSGPDKAILTLLR